MDAAVAAFDGLLSSWKGLPANLRVQLLGDVRRVFGETRLIGEQFTLF